MGKEFFQVRSTTTGKFLCDSHGFYGSPRVYISIGGAKAGYTNYLRSNNRFTTPPQPAEIVVYSADEMCTRPLGK